jgi:hypothetical protein
MTTIIRVTSREKITTIRVTESTKRELESLGQSGETHEEIIKKLIKFAKSAFSESDTKIIKDKNVIGTKYGRLTKTFEIETDKGIYSIVCSYNDLSPMALISSNKNLQENLAKEWELNLELINLGVSLKNQADRDRITWSSPNMLQEHDRDEFLLLYLVAVKGVLEYIFGIKIYEMITREDYYNIEKWRNAYNRNNLSMESFYHDIQKKMR